jgi:hypothetical protein
MVLPLQTIKICRECLWFGGFGGLRKNKSCSTALPHPSLDPLEDWCLAWSSLTWGFLLTPPRSSPSTTPSSSPSMAPASSSPCRSPVSSRRASCEGPPSTPSWSSSSSSLTRVRSPPPDAQQLSPTCSIRLSPSSSCSWASCHCTCLPMLTPTVSSPSPYVVRPRSALHVHCSMKCCTGGLMRFVVASVSSNELKNDYQQIK